MAIMSVRYIVVDVDAAVEFYTKLTGLASVRYLIDDVRAAVDFYSIHLGLAVALSDGAIGIPNERARALVAVVVGMIGMNLGGLAFARSRRSHSKACHGHGAVAGLVGCRGRI